MVSFGFKLPWHRIIANTYFTQLCTYIFFRDQWPGKWQVSLNSIDTTTRLHISLVRGRKVKMYGFASTTTSSIIVSVFLHVCLNAGNIRVFATVIDWSYWTFLVRNRILCLGGEMSQVGLETWSSYKISPELEVRSQRYHQGTDLYKMSVQGCDWRRCWWVLKKWHSYNWPWYLARSSKHPMLKITYWNFLLAYLFVFHNKLFFF